MQYPKSILQAEKAAYSKLDASEFIPMVVRLGL